MTEQSSARRERKIQADEFAAWKKRLDGAWSVLTVLLHRVETIDGVGGPEADPQRMATIARLLGALKLFGDQQFKFLDEGLGGQTALVLHPHQDGKQGLSPTYAFAMVLHQIASDLQIIQRAQEQRSVSFAPAQAPFAGRIARLLQIADQVAFVGLTVFQTHLPGLVGAAEGDAYNYTTLTYLHPTPDVRILPYAPVALIGVPLSCIGQLDAEQGMPLAPDDLTVVGLGRELLAIPHELGHYLYWNGADAVQTARGLELVAAMQAALGSLRNILRTSLTGLPAWTRRWLEEIFSDVVGCVIGGPAVALYFQDLQLQARNDWMTVDDGVYPIPALRPYIYIAVLRQLGMEHAANWLEERWNYRLQLRALTPPTHLDQPPFDFSPFQQPQALAAPIGLGSIELAVATIWAAFSSSSEMLSRAALYRWSSDDEFIGYSAAVTTAIGQGTDVEALLDTQSESIYRQFETVGLPRLLQHFERIGQPLDSVWTAKPWLDLVERRGVAYDALVAHLPPDKEPTPAEVLAKLRQWLAGAAQAPVEFSFSEWRPLLEFAGWTTEGPTDGKISGR